MRLIELTSNQPGFKSVKFNETGLTLVVGSRSNNGATYNGVGKSLIVELIHFCLGANKNSEFESKIPNWEFQLKFELSGKVHTVARNTSKQNIVYLDNEEKKLSDFLEFMGSNSFSLPSDIGGLSFRALITKFLRRGQGEYVDACRTNEHSDYDVLLRSCFLLGIETSLIQVKSKLKTEIKNLKTLQRNFKDDPLIKEYFSGGRDADIHVKQLEQKIERLDKAREEFRVAENYYELQTSAKLLASEIESDKNKVFLNRSAIANIDLSLRERPVLELTKFKALYSEMEAVFRENILKRLDDVSEFHEKLLTNRVARLSGEKLRLMQTLTEMESSLKVKQKSLDDLLKILGESTALDQYTAVVNEAASLTAELNKLRDYKQIQLQYSNKTAELEGQLSSEIIKTNSYLEDTKSFRDENFSVFTNYVSKFYPNSAAGISLNNDCGNNQTRFKLDVRVENDSSDGINEVRIFCYDLTLLTLRMNHKIKFIFHDSRLYSNMDVRQRATLFRVADKVCRENGFQYIATLNPDSISGMAGEFSVEEMASIIDGNIVLELKDNAPSGKLLGIQVDMQYERRN